MADIGIILGSDSDIPKVKGCFEILEEFGTGFEIAISSAHRTPDMTKEWVSTAGDRGIKVIIAAAGGAAHLPGVAASHTTLPVIGVPVESGISGGMDSVLSILQMPSGIPVAAMPVGKAGGVNAALFAIAILSLSDESYMQKLKDYRKKLAEIVTGKDDKLKAVGYKEYIKKYL